MFRLSILLLLGLTLTAPIHAELKRKNIEYRSEGETMEGYLAVETGKKKKMLPAVLIVHDWMGPSAFTKKKAAQLASEGYIAFAVDLYGKDNRPKDEHQAAELSKKYKDDRALMRKRMRAAYDKLIQMNSVNAKKIVVMGYCFGGTAALELARSGVPLAGTVSFHGGLGTPNPNDAKNIKGPVLVLHGQDDPFVPKDEVDAFKAEMKQGNVNLEFIEYPDAVHAFTNPAAGRDNSKGAAYNPEADRASWSEFEEFLNKVTH